MVDQKHLVKALENLGNDKDFQLVLEWLQDERNVVIQQLAGVQPSEILQNLSGRLIEVTLIIERIQKQKR